MLFTVAMGLHFVPTDRGLEELYPRRFAAHGRGLLAGSVLLNVFTEELPSDGTRVPAGS